MGLDIYAGTLTRYYSNNWKTNVQRFCEDNGIEFSQVDGNGVELKEREQSPEEICEIVSEWRDRIIDMIEQQKKRSPSLFNIFRKKKITNLTWEENNTKDYYTDKPDWDAYGALLLFTASIIYHEEIPKTLPSHWDFESNPLIQRIKKDEKVVGWSLFRETMMWLPINEGFSFRDTAPDGNEIIISTSGNLLSELYDINANSWNADEDTILNWRKTEGYDANEEIVDAKDNALIIHDDVSNTESLAKFAFSIMYSAAKYSLKNRVPIVFDY